MESRLILYFSWLLGVGSMKPSRLEAGLFVTIVALVAVMYLSAHFDFYRSMIWAFLSPIGTILVIWGFALQVRRLWRGCKS